MGYEKKEWLELKRNGVKFELVVRDQDFKRLDTIRFGPKTFGDTMKDIGNRYGIDKKNLKPNKEIEDEMSWLKKSNII